VKFSVIIRVLFNARGQELFRLTSWMVYISACIWSPKYSYSHYLQISGSTMLNLSLLTSDMWAVVIRIFAYHEKVC
jgi:hypothetical protein